MGSKNQVTLTFAGEYSQIEKTFDRVGQASDRMARDVKSASGSMDRVEGSFDRIDNSAMGFRDSITGASDTMRGWRMLTANTGEEMDTLRAKIDEVSASGKARIDSLRDAEKKRLDDLKKQRREEINGIKDQRKAEIARLREAGAGADEIAAAERRYREEINRTSDSYASRADEVKESYDQQITGIQEATKQQTETMKAQLEVLEQQSGSTAEALFTLGAGVGDLASAVVNLGVPLARSAASWVGSTKLMSAATLKSNAIIVGSYVKTAAVTTATMTVSVAKQVAQWVILSAASLANAALVAAAWLISMGPILLVGAAVVALVVLVIKNWDTIVSVVRKGGEAIARILGRLLGWIRDNWRKVLPWMTGPIGIAVSMIVRHRDTILRVIRAVPGAIRSAFSGAGRWLWDAGKSIINGLVDGIKSQAGRVGDAVKSVVPSSVRGTVGRVFGGFRAEGGRVRSDRAYIVGEQRAETFVPDTAGTIVPTSGGNTTVNVSVETNADPMRIGAEIVNGLTMAGLVGI